MRQFIASILVFSCFCVFGQEKVHQSIIYTNVFHQLDFSHPRINLGYEHAVGRKSKVGINLGVYHWFSAEQERGLNVHVEYKTFTESQFYYSFGIAGAGLDYIANCSFRMDGQVDEVQPIYEERVKIDKKIADLFFKYGFQEHWGKHIVFDAYTGLGLRLKDVDHAGRTRPEDAMYSHDFNPGLIRDKEGRFVKPIFRFGVLIGFGW